MCDRNTQQGPSAAGSLASSTAPASCSPLLSPPHCYPALLTFATRCVTLTSMSVWDQHDVLNAVVAALGTVPTSSSYHHFGRPWITAYQLAIKVHTADPTLAASLGVTVGGQGTGKHTSLSQYLARELSRNIKKHGDAYPVRGAFLSNQLVRSIELEGPEGPVTSSLTGTPYDLSLFRLAP